MILRPPRSTRTDTLFPYTSLFRSEVQVPVEVIAERHAVVEFDCALAGGRVAAQQQRRQMFACEQFLLQANLSVAVVMLDVGIVVALGVGRIFLGVFRDPIPGLQVQQQSEESRVGKECVSTGRSRWSP